MQLADARKIEIRVPDGNEYEVTLTGEQLKFLLHLIASNQFPGNKVFLVSETMMALQKPLLDEAHGGAPDA